MLQNPRGLKLFSNNAEVHYSLAICQELGVSALGMQETNINWGHKLAHTILHNAAKKTWEHYSYSVSHTEDKFMTGTATILANKWISRIVDKGTDPFGLGRWNYITLRGKNGKRVTLITAYRVCVQTLAACGQTMATTQQHRMLSKKLEWKATQKMIPNQGYNSY
jgi:hypothetical protein